MTSKILTDEEFIRIYEQIFAAEYIDPTNSTGTIRILTAIRILYEDHIKLKKKFHILENAFIKLYSEKKLCDEIS